MLIGISLIVTALMIGSYFNSIRLAAAVYFGLGALLLAITESGKYKETDGLPK